MSQRVVKSMERSLPWQADIRLYTEEILLNILWGCIYRWHKLITLHDIETQNTRWVTPPVNT
jgi:hypothetical protein